jgi:hypothetical protein
MDDRLTKVSKDIINELIELGYKLPLDLVDWITKEPDPPRNIRGSAIPEAEVVRGSSITPKLLHDELELWRNNPELAPYTPTPDEEKRLTDQWKSA